MIRRDIVSRVRALTRDFSNSIFREQDILDFINEGVNRFKQVISELRSMQKLLSPTQEPTPLPEEFHHLLALYASSRCFSQDERHYQATTLMNEFETKLEELKSGIENGTIVIVDENGDAIQNDNDVDYVSLSPYWTKGKGVFQLYDEDNGVEGVE